MGAVTRDVLEAIHQRRSGPNPGSDLFATVDPFKQTAAEASAGVTPVNYAYAPGDVRRYGAVGDGSTDDTAALQRCANGCGGVMSFPPNATFLVSAQISIPAGTVIYGSGSTLNASSTWSTTGWHLLNAQGSILVELCNFTVPAVARNTTWKAITADNALQGLAPGTRVVVRNCSITDLDIGVYADGGAAQNIEYYEVSGCHIVINTLGTGGGSSVRPTVSCNNVVHVRINSNPLLDASDPTNAVNNIYTIGCIKIDISDNKLVRGVGTKILSNPTNGVQHVCISRNRFLSTQYHYFLADGAPIAAIELTDNFFDSPNTNIATPEVVLFETTATAITGNSFGAFNSEGNSFVNCPHSVYFFNMSAGKTFGSASLGGNTYNNTSTSSAGAYGILSNGGAGSYTSITAVNETVVGNGSTRAYIQAALTFASQNFGDIIESGCTNARSGVNQGSYTGTLVNGVSGAVTGTLKWTERDGLVTLQIPAITDTSTSTAQKQITGSVPNNIKPASVQVCSGAAEDNSTGKLSLVQIETTGTITLYNGVSAVFTAAGTCGSVACTVTYRTTT